MLTHHTHHRVRPWLRRGVLALSVTVALGAFAFALLAQGVPATPAAPAMPQAPHAAPASQGAVHRALPILVGHAVTAEGLGAAQGAAVHAGALLIYGDAETGVVREYSADAGNEELRPTGRVLRLTRDGVDLLPHPTGLTFHADYGVFVGDTVARKGTIYHVDWDRAMADGTLDHAVLNTTRDDVAVNGCRPEFVRFGGRWLVATSDYGPRGNQVRLYDPQRLAEAQTTSEPGVLVRAWSCGPWVQSLCWLDEPGVLLLVQNQVEGLRYRVSAVRLPEDPAAGAVEVLRVVDLPEPADELEGLAMLGPGRAVLVNSSREKNVWFAGVDVPALLRGVGDARVD